MKMYYPPVQILDADPKKILNFPKSLCMLAINQKREIVVVRELYHEEVWENYWKQVDAGQPLSAIKIKVNPYEDPYGLSSRGHRLSRGLKYIMAKNYIFFGLLYLDDEVFDKSILYEGIFSKRKNKFFMGMEKKYRSAKYFPTIEEDNSIEIGVIGKGEAYFAIEKISFDKLAGISNDLRGALTGIAGILTDYDSKREEYEDQFMSRFNLVILSQNISRNKNPQKFKIDKKGRELLRDKIKSETFIPAAAFKFDYGLNSLANIDDWGLMRKLPEVKNTLKLYEKYIQLISVGKKSPIKYLNFLTIFDEKIPLEIKDLVQKPSEPLVIPSIRKVNEGATPIGGQAKAKSANDTTSIPPVVKSEQSMVPNEAEETNIVPERTAQELNLKVNRSKTAETELSEPITNYEADKTVEQIDKEAGISNAPKIKPQGASLKLKKVSLNKLKPIDYSVSGPEAITENVDTIEEPQSAMDEDLVYSEEFITTQDGEIDDAYLHKMTSYLDSLLGKEIDESKLSLDEIYKELEESINAISKLEQWAQKDEAISKIYYPPPTLISYANKIGMKIGASTVIVSIGAGRNIFMIPEIKRIQMWCKFYNDLEGNPIIKDFEALESKDLNSEDQLKEIIINTFKQLINNRIFFALCDIEGNAFERNIFEECELEQKYLEKLIDIHIERRKSLKFPVISEENEIEVRYFGKEEIINFLDNPESQGLLEIAFDSKNDPRWNKGIISGIVCVDEESSYFFILSDNFEEIKTGGPYKFKIDYKTLDKMLSLIERADITPVSWFRMQFGLDSLNTIPLWKNVKNDPEVLETLNEYNKFVEKLIETKKKEDKLRKKLEEEMEELSGLRLDELAAKSSDVNVKLDSYSDDFEKLKDNLKPIICPKCGFENPPNATSCSNCHHKFELNPE